MANARILGKSYADDVTLTATSEALAASNLQNTDVRRVWRSTGTSAQTISWDLGSARARNGIYIGNCNLTDSGTINYQLSNDSGFSTKLVDETFSPWADDQAFRDAVCYFDSATGRYERIIVTDASNPDGYMEIGRIKVGDFFAAPNSSNIVIGPSIQWLERGALQEARGGNFIPQVKTPKRVLRVRWQWVHEDDAFTLGDNEFAELLRITGQRDDVVLSAYPEQGDDMERVHTVLGYITDKGAVDGHFDRVTASGVELYSAIEIEVSEST